MVSLVAKEVSEKELVEMFIGENSLPPFAHDVLRSMDDCRQYESLFHGESHDVSMDLMQYKTFLIETSTITLDSFLQMCYTNKVRQAFETTFFQSFNDERMEIIMQSLAGGKVTLEEVFTKFKKNPNRNIMRYFKK